jgi:hypothetical protein
MEGRAARGGRDVLRLLAVGALLVVVAALVLKLRLPRPFIWIWLAALVACFRCAVRAASPWGRRIFLTGFSLAMGLSLLEMTFATLAKLKPGGLESSGTYVEGGYFVQGGDLGYGPAPGVRVTSKLTWNSPEGRVPSYDVVYTISDQGVRVTRGNPDGDTWLFTGCSMMFGEGVNDDETLPAYFSAALDHRANVVNLGFHGYGPHQMLRSLETDRTRPLLHGVVKQVVYEGIYDHPIRAAGKDAWDVFGPSYVLAGDGVAYAGPFHGRFVGLVRRVLRKSDFVTFVLDRVIPHAKPSDEDIERYARILERSAQLAREKLGAGFTVIYWDADGESSARVLARLRKTDLSIMLVSDVIPRSEWAGLRIPGDVHPKPEVNRRLAAALAARFREGIPPGR